LCFDVQQAAEKALKGLLLHLEVSFPYTHDLADLITLLEDQHSDVPDTVKDLSLKHNRRRRRHPSASRAGSPVQDKEKIVC